MYYCNAADSRSIKGSIRYKDSQVEGYIVDHPEASSELMVLIRAGEDIFGGIDVESVEPAAFTAEDEKAIGSIADKLAEQLMAERR